MADLNFGRVETIIKKNIEIDKVELVEYYCSLTGKLIAAYTPGAEREMELNEMESSTTAPDRRFSIVDEVFGQRVPVYLSKNGLELLQKTVAVIKKLSEEDNLKEIETFLDLIINRSPLIEK